MNRGNEQDIVGIGCSGRAVANVRCMPGEATRRGIRRKGSEYVCVAIQEDEDHGQEDEQGDEHAEL